MINIKFFLTQQSEGKAFWAIHKIQLVVEEKLCLLSKNMYGNELNNIFFLTICMSDEKYNVGGFGEKTYFDRKKAEISIWKRLDYYSFIKLSYDMQYQTYVEHLIASLELLKPKLIKTGFDFDRFIIDIKDCC